MFGQLASSVCTRGYDSCNEHTSHILTSNLYTVSTVLAGVTCVILVVGTRVLNRGLCFRVNSHSLWNIVFIYFVATEEWIIVVKLEVSFSSVLHHSRVLRISGPLTLCLLISQPYKSSDLGFIVLEGPLW